jgi:Family of unknown function (DUF5330)
MGILRNTLIITGLAIAMPSPPPSETADVVPSQGSTIAYVSAAAEAFADVRTFCQRQPGVCQTAGHIAAIVEAKAKYSAKLIYEWASEAADPNAVKTVSGNETAAAGIDHSTLKLEDLLPEWRKPGQPNKG